MLLKSIVLGVKEEVFLKSKGSLWRLLSWIHRESIVPDDQMVVGMCSYFFNNLTIEA